MHSLALELQAKGYNITGSDDEIYDPSHSRLKKAGILPEKMGWFPEKIIPGIDAIILGMHARKDNPELVKALQMEIPVYSYPSWLYRESIEKKRVVVAGSHGKTTTTAMIMAGLQSGRLEFDYMVGAPLEGFDKMVKLTNTPLIVLEGDEYLSSPIDRRPKIHHYRPHLAIITGIAWDHINVFPDFDMYVDQFKIFILQIERGGILIYNEDDEEISKIIQDLERKDLRLIPYTGMDLNAHNQIVYKGKEYNTSLVGRHNFLNMSAAMKCCIELGVSAYDFLNGMSLFKGAAKRLQEIYRKDQFIAYLDYAHAPSKVMTTVGAVRDWYYNKKVVAILELHTYSSLNIDFIPHYRNCFTGIQEGIVFYNDHTIAMKKLSPLNPDKVKAAFGEGNIKVITNRDELKNYLLQLNKSDTVLLLMTSGNFEGLHVKELLSSTDRD